MSERTLLFCERCKTWVDPEGLGCPVDLHHLLAAIPLSTIAQVPEVLELVEDADWLLATSRASVDGQCDVCSAPDGEPHDPDEACGQTAAALAPFREAPE